MTDLICGDCKFHLNRDLCPRAEYRKHEDNLIACASTDKACELFKPKTRKKNKVIAPDMGEALALLNENLIFKCPTDTRELLMYDNGIYKQARFPVEELLEQIYEEKLKKHFVDEIIEHLKRANYVERGEINKFSNKIPILNGLFNFQTFELSPFNPKEIFTYKLPVDYCPTANCPNFLKFLKEILPEESSRDLLQEICGYCLLPAMPFHVLIWFYGIGRNGKGRITFTLEHIIGDENVSNLNLSEFSEGRRFSLHMLYGKFVNISSEPKLSKYGLQTNVLKLISGEDTIDAELKGKNKRLRFKNVAKPIILGNRFPKVEDTSLGWWDRVVVLQFPNSFTGKDCIPNIERKWIPEELSGIFNWMLKGLYRLKENGEFSTSKSTEEIKAEFMRISDPLRAWLNDCVNFLPVGKVTRDEAYSSYSDYCDELGVIPEKARSFYNKLRDTPKVKPYRTTRMKKTERGFEGISLKTLEERENKEIQTEIVSEMPEMSESYTQETMETINKSKEDSEHDIRDISDITVIDKYFPDNQYRRCFCCSKPIIHLDNLTNLEGKPCHKKCKTLIKSGKNDGGQHGV